MKERSLKAPKTNRSKKAKQATNNRNTVYNSRQSVPTKEQHHDENHNVPTEKELNAIKNESNQDRMNAIKNECT